MAALLLNALEIEFLKHLNSFDVRYLVVGGHTVAYHGHLREMKDLDNFVETSTHNAACVVNALRDRGFDGEDLTVEKFSQRIKQIPLRGHYSVELLTSLAGVDFVPGYYLRVISDEGSSPVHVIGRSDLLITKRLIARPQYLADIEALGHSWPAANRGAN